MCKSIRRWTGLLPLDLWNGSCIAFAGRALFSYSLALNSSISHHAWSTSPPALLWTDSLRCDIYDLPHGLYSNGHHLPPCHLLPWCSPGIHSAYRPHVGCRSQGPVGSWYTPGSDMRETCGGDKSACRGGNLRCSFLFHTYPLLMSVLVIVVYFGTLARLVHRKERKLTIKRTHRPAVNKEYPVEARTHANAPPMTELELPNSLYDPVLC